MPFERLIPHPLTPNGVRTYAPVIAGVYGISNAREWVFIGLTDNIQQALLEHLRDRTAPVSKRLPTGFVFETCMAGRRTARSNSLILEYSPVCNVASARPREFIWQKRNHGTR